MNIDDLRFVLPEFLKNPPVTLNQDRDAVQALFDKLCLLVFNDERDRVPHYVLTEEEYKILKDIGFNNISDFSGQYADLIGIPDIPSKVEDLEDGIDYATKNYVQAYIGAPIPRKTSDLENDMRFITSEDIPAIPIRVSELENDAGYITGDEMDELFNGTFQEDGTTRNDDGIFPRYLSRFQDDVGYARSCDVYHCVKLSDIGISFGSEPIEETLKELAKILKKDPALKLNVVYRGSCYNQEVLRMFSNTLNDCYIEIKVVERTSSKMVFEVTVTSTDITLNPYRYVKLYEINFMLNMPMINKESVSWYATHTNLQDAMTEEKVNELIKNKLKDLVQEALDELGFYGNIDNVDPTVYGQLYMLDENGTAIPLYVYDEYGNLRKQYVKRN